MMIRLVMLVVACVCAFGLTEPTFAAPVDNPARCIDIDQGRSGDFSYMENSCNQTLNVRWRDQGHCRTGCSIPIRPASRQTITGMQGDVRWAACVYPETPRPTGGGQHYCE